MFERNSKFETFQETRVPVLASVWDWEMKATPVSPGHVTTVICLLLLSGWKQKPLISCCGFRCKDSSGPAQKSKAHQNIPLLHSFNLFSWNLFFLLQVETKFTLCFFFSFIMLNSKVHIYLLMLVCARMEEEGGELRSRAQRRACQIFPWEPEAPEQSRWRVSSDYYLPFQTGRGSKKKKKKTKIRTSCDLPLNGLFTNPWAMSKRAATCIYLKKHVTARAFMNNWLDTWFDIDEVINDLKNKSFWGF